jgi:glycosyltransferase involved in cell wall biosynthesis
VRIGFDATSLAAEGKGLARFQREFLRAAPALLGADELVVFAPEDVEGSLLSPGAQFELVDPRPMLRWEQLERPRRARRLGLDVVIHLSERGSLFGPPQVAYVYEHPRHRAWRNREVGGQLRQRLVDGVTLVLFRLALRRVDEVLCASEATRRDVGRGEVVYPGVSSAFTPGSEERSYFLHLASDDPRDNSAVVLEAVARLEPTPALVVGGNAAGELREQAAKLGLAVEWTGFVRDEALARLYRGALAYVDPSLHEGFGLQAAEALACGTPVICSNVDALSEVIGDAGILLDPHDVEGFAEAIRRLGDDDDVRAKLSRRARERAKAFDWDETVRRTLAAARRVSASAE